ncbi:MAG TPA: hypothetical protein PKA28_11245 [Methylomusa anaerophila]|uniref:Chromosome partition protein Smc n=1 Tax=Methylomusa anaerophila TaxID=1930071 RepID=A0A348AJ85_9FIRM|nr:hypothetical protein [Methylomusa anaerophila]BBB91133.1 chromosome partition protein Smc [Methylomusa anaerophila]HML89009.1 hypothetical protein [Methylomusa anaerophila]
MEEILKLLLEEVKGLKGDIQSLKQGQQQTDQRLDRMESDITGIKSDITGINSNITGINSDIAGIKSDITSINSDITDLKTTVSNIEGQQMENSRIIHALRHNSEEVNAQLHNIGHNLDVLTGKAATKEDVSELNAKFDVLNNRLFQQEAAIHQLKAVK